MCAERNGAVRPDRSFPDAGTAVSRLSPPALAGHKDGRRRVDKNRRENYAVARTVHSA